MKLKIIFHFYFNLKLSVTNKERERVRERKIIFLKIIYDLKLFIYYKQIRKKYQQRLKRYLINIFKCKTNSFLGHFERQHSFLKRLFNEVSSF